MNTDSTGRFFNAAAGQGHGWIAARVPHQGRMCLLDSVLQASENGLLCAADSHRDPGNPLRQQGRLGAACGIEYAGQAMALHGALLAEAQGHAAPAGGMLVSVRAVTFHAARLDGVAARLLVSVLSDAVSGPTRLYRFTLHAENIHAGNIQAENGPLLLQGRAVVQLTPPRAPSVP